MKIDVSPVQGSFKQIYKLGFWSGLAAFASTVAYDAAQILQVFGVLNGVLSGIFIYGFSLCIVIPFLIEILVLHHTTVEEKKFWSHAALIFTTLYAVFVTANYVVQLATVIPMSAKGALNEIRILDQTPHSLFWDFDAIGYIFMGLATLVAVPVFQGHGSQRWVKIFFLANGLVTPLITFVYFYPNFTEKLVLVGLPWAVTAPGSMLSLALLFRKSYSKRRV